ncbi:hypothetical protein [Streptomyces sp. NBC_00057]
MLSSVAHIESFAAGQFVIADDGDLEAGQDFERGEVDLSAPGC